MNHKFISDAETQNFFIIQAIFTAVFENRCSLMSTSEELKNQGNRYFANGRYAEAIACYNKCIIKNPNNSKYFTNRGLTYLRLKKWDLAAEDCRKAIDLDPKSLKGYFFLGQAFIELGYYDEAISSLQKAFNLSRDFNLNYGDDIAQNLRIAKSKRWAILEKVRIQHESELQKLMKTLLKEKCERDITICKEKYTMKDDDEKLEASIQDIVDKYEQNLLEVDLVYEQIDAKRKLREVPDYLCGKISFEIMRDPVITPSGITYDRKNIEEHLQRVGHFDPVTRVPLTADQLIPNLALKEVIDAYVTENPWIIDY